MGGLRLLVVVACVMLCSEHAMALIFNVRQGEDMCFHEMAHKGNKVLGYFEVTSWGYGTYVSVKVASPQGRQIYERKSSSEDRIEFHAEEDGEYSFCFSTGQRKTNAVKFWVNTDTDFAIAGLVKDEHVKDMWYEVERLESLIASAKVDLKAFKSRESKHRMLVNKNGRRVTIWAIVECVLIVGVAAAQIFRLQKFLENKRSV